MGIWYWIYGGLWLGLFVGALILVGYILSGPVYFLTKSAIIASDSYFRAEGVEKYVYLVALPLIGALVGALFGVGIQTLVENPPKISEGRTAAQTAAYIELMLAMILMVAGPTILTRLVRKESNIVLSGRVWLLEREYADAGKSDLLAALDEALDEEAREYRKGRARFRVLTPLSVFLVSAYLAVFWSTYPAPGPLGQIAVLIIAYGCAVVSRVWIRRKGYERAVRHLSRYRDEVEAMKAPTPPGPAVPVLPESRTLPIDGSARGARWLAAGSLAASILSLLAALISIARRDQ